jgi:hypothetical protein
MKRTLILLALIYLMVQLTALAQTQDPPRYELAGEFTTLNREKFNGVTVDPGVGARFTFNFNKKIAIEAASHLSFNDECFSCENGGRYVDVFAGLKVGKRYKSWGVFAKARPGMVSFPTGQFDILPTPSILQFEVVRKRLDNFATDLGAVVEFYPSRRIVTRFDAGDTIIHFSRRTNTRLGFDPATGNNTIFPFTTPARTTHNFQFIASVGWRF